MLVMRRSSHSRVKAWCRRIVEPKNGLLTLVAGHVDIGMKLEVLREEVAQRMILLLENEVGGVGHALRGRQQRCDGRVEQDLTRIHLLLYLLLALGKEEELKTEVLMERLGNV
ncbi:hypothetical protein CP532_2673 [Ophiocordyceps camponoti-leonardi (nom. inval.)]|nr:hypothetical protein CP532_2673 [Ophiocordyceps camponoti-leonardi (nom. inval.)]